MNPPSNLSTYFDFVHLDISSEPFSGYKMNVFENVEKLSQLYVWQIDARSRMRQISEYFLRYLSLQ